MAYTHFIAAIDLGSSHMVGMVGMKGPTGALSIIASEVENSATCIRRGCVHNIKEAAGNIVRMIRKLNNKLGDSRIAKVYIGVGGQSLRTIDHKVSKVLGDGVVTEELLRGIDEECRQYHPEMLDVLAIDSPVYYLDNLLDVNPVGMTCSRIEACYKLIVGWPALRRAVTANMAEYIKKDVAIAGIIVSPLALADLVLTEKEKTQGCALIDFGAGVTSVTMYKEGKLVAMYVIPLGCQLITRDLMSLENISEKEAERLKRTYGNAVWEKDQDQQLISVDLADGIHSGEIKLSDINKVVDARCREIIDNIYARLEDGKVSKEMGYSIVIAGGGAALKNMREALSTRFNMEVRYASIRKGVVTEGELIANNAEYSMAVALLLKGTENCAAYVAPEPKKPEPMAGEEVVPEPEKKEEGEEEKTKVPRSTTSKGGTSKGGKIPKDGTTKGGTKGIGDIFGTWFDKAAGKVDSMLKDE